jgi:hypothetical protein
LSGSVLVAGKPLIGKRLCHNHSIGISLCYLSVAADSLKNSYKIKTAIEPE